MDQTTSRAGRGEKVSAQAVISAPAAVGGLTCTVGDFVADNGAKLPGIARARFVKYVVSDRFRPTNLRRTAGEQPGAPRSGPARRGGFMRRARPVDPSRLDHGRHPARRRPRPLHGSGCGKGRRRRRNADAAPERHGTHPARALGVDLPPSTVSIRRPWPAPKG